MLFVRSALSIIVLALSVVNAVILKVTVGPADGPGAFDPDSLDATVGDIVTFTWGSSFQSVTQGPVPDNCSTLPGGFDSGVQKLKFVYNVTIATVGTIAVHSKPHCIAGMQMTINVKESTPEPEPEQPPCFTIGRKLTSCITDAFLKIIVFTKWF